MPKRATRVRNYSPAFIADLCGTFDSGEMLAAQILRQAVDDWRDVRAGKPQTFANPYREYPQRELQSFFAGEWCTFLVAHLGFDPDVFLRKLRDDL